MTSNAAITFPHAERVGISSPQVIPAVQGARMIAHALIPEDGTPTFLARFVDEEFAPFVQADVYDAQVTVFDESDGSSDWVWQAPVASADVMFDTLQTDARWREDSEGYNFRYTYDNDTVRLQGGRRYRFEVTLNLVAGGAVSQVYSVETLPLMSRRS